MTPLRMVGTAHIDLIYETMDLTLFRFNIINVASTNMRSEVLWRWCHLSRMVSDIYNYEGGASLKKIMLL